MREIVGGASVAMLVLMATPEASGTDGESASLGRVIVARDIPKKEAQDILRGGQGGSVPAGSPWTERKYEFFCTHDRITAEDGASCTPCDDPEASRYSVQERTGVVGGATSPWRVLGYTCLTDSDLGDIDTVVITPAMVLAEFRRLDWPRAPLTLEPGDGMTLVNLVTVAYSDNSGPLTQSVTLLGQQVEIEATPESWTWHWGDGTVETTTHPGEPKPRGSVTHAYRHAAESVGVRVDLTYTGRFRVNGGAWQQIPEPATVRGDAQQIGVNEAVVQLVR